MSSVNIAGSRLLAPYIVVVDLTIRCRRLGAFWQAARSCIVPMTLSSFIVPRPPALPGVAMTLMWTTVSTSSFAITLAITGLRMSARTKATSPMSSRGGTASTPTTRSTSGSAARRRAKRRPRSRETPVTRTIFPTVVSLAGGLLPELAALDARLLQQLAVLLLRHPLATLLDDRTHENPLPERLVRGPGGPGRPRQPSRQGVSGRIRAVASGTARSAGAVEALAEVLVDVVLGHPEGAADANRGQLSVVDQAVDRHLGHAHHRGDLSHGEELDVGDVSGLVGRHRRHRLSWQARTGFPSGDSTSRASGVRIGPDVTRGEGNRLRNPRGLRVSGCIRPRIASGERPRRAQGSGSRPCSGKISSRVELIERSSHVAGS